MRRTPATFRHLLTTLLAAAAACATASPASSAIRVESTDGFYGDNPVPDLAIGGNGQLWGAQPGYTGGLWNYTTDELWSPQGLNPAAQPRWLAAGADGNTWFTEGFFGRERIGRMTAAGETTVFSEGLEAGGVGQLALGSDGNLWFTRLFGQLGRITPTGQITLYPANGTDEPITAGPDGALWFLASDRVGRITTAGDISYSKLTVLDSSEDLTDITTGSDGNLWILASHSIVRMTPAGQATRFTGDLDSAYPLHDAALGPDGNVWFAGPRCEVGRITPGGAITRFSNHLTACQTVYAISGGPDGNLWWTATRYPNGSRDGETVNTLTRMQAEWSPRVSIRKDPPVTETTASLSGEVTAEGLPTTAHLEWGTTTAFGTSGPEISIDGYEPASLTAQATGLRPGRGYFARIVSTNALGTNSWNAFEFRTAGTAPEAPLPPTKVTTPTKPTTPGAATGAGTPSVSTTAKVLAVTSSGILRLPLTCTGGTCSTSVTITGKVAKGGASAVIARKSLTIATDRTAKAGLRVSSAGRKAIRKAGRKGLSVIVTVAVGSKKTRYRVTLKG